MKHFTEQDNYLCGLHGRKKGIQFNIRTIPKKIVYFLLEKSLKNIVPHVIFMIWNSIASLLFNIDIVEYKFTI